MRQVVEVGHEHHPDPRLDECVDDLASDLGTFALVGGGQRFVAQEHAPGGDVIGDLAHPAQLFVELALRHGGVLLTLEVGEHSLADAGTQRARRDEHPALQHQLGHADAAQKGGLPALIGAGDHHQ
jgi:hypothetical protein